MINGCARQAALAMPLVLLMGSISARADEAAKPIYPSPPRPASRPGDWASDNDYPRKAMSIGATGYVAFQLSVADNGKPTACEVIASSNNADLDKTTCDLMLARARFTPATDAEGKPVAGLYRSTVRWMLPDRPPPLPAQSRFAVSYDVLPDGRVSNCTVTVTGLILAKVPDKPQSLCAGLGPFAPQHNAQGKPVKKHVAAENSVTITEVP